MAWIESHQSLGTHPKLDRLCEILDIEDTQGVGLLQYLWWWTIDYAVDGNISKYTPGQIAKAAHWKGDRKVLLPALIESGFVDEGADGRHVHDWFDFCGTLVEKRLDRHETAKNAAKSRWDKHKKHTDKSTLGTESIPHSSHTHPVRMPTYQPTVPTNRTNQPAKTASRDSASHSKGNGNGASTTGTFHTPGDSSIMEKFRHRGVVGSQLKKLDRSHDPVFKFLLVIKQLQGYQVTDKTWDDTYLDQYRDDAVKCLRFFGEDWKTAAKCAVALVKEFKEKELSWSLRTIINRAPFWRQQHEKETATA